MYIYTICSYSNLNQAIVLYNSIRANTKNSVEFKVFLIDEMLSEVAIDDSSIELIFVSNLKKLIPDFNELHAKYNPFELCCALKPYCAEYLMKICDSNDLIIYLDSDILFYNDIQIIQEEIGNKLILLTPHFTEAPPDFDKISELDVNNSGLYNGGFFAFKNCNETAVFIDWWKKRTTLFCFTDFKNGMFVDQIWLNFVPLYFSNVCITSHKGMNVAYWNFHERQLSKNEEQSWVINKTYPLLFIHFSGYRLYRKDLISIHQTRYNFNDLPEVNSVFNEYAALLELNSKRYNFKSLKRSKSQRILSKLKSVFQSPFSK